MFLFNAPRQLLSPPKRARGAAPLAWSEPLASVSIPRRAGTTITAQHPGVFWFPRSAWETTCATRRVAAEALPGGLSPATQSVGDWGSRAERGKPKKTVLRCQVSAQRTDSSVAGNGPKNKTKG